MTRLTVTATPAEATDLAAQRIAAVIAGEQPAHVALAGGNTPRASYERLARTVEDWSNVELWLGDERMVAPDSPDANLRMVSETLVERVAGPPPVLHPVPTELPADRAAAAYAKLLAERLPGDLPALSVALLGLGPDAHTASLFPGAPALAERSALCVAVHDAPKPPPDRVTLTLPVFAAARRLIVLATGAGKALAVTAMLAAPDPTAPASLIARERLELIVDEAAAGAVPAAGRA